MYQPASLLALGAHYQQEVCQHYGQPQAELQQALQGNIVCHLSHLALMQIQGEDSVNFLQGQLTNDIRLLDGKSTQYAAYCTPKGRMLALFLAFAHEQHWHLIAPYEQMNFLIQRLRMFVMRSKVAIQDKRDEIVVLGLAGQQMPERLSRIFSHIPEQAHSMVSLPEATLIRLPSAHPMFLLMASQQSIETLLGKLLVDCQAVGKPAWDALNIQAGLPQVVTATQECFVPQMLNLDVLNGISFKKGCYTGQEIVARTHYLGTVKRRMQIAHLACTAAIQPGQPIHTLNSPDAVGMVVNAAPNLTGGTDLLIEVRLDNVQPQAMAENPLQYQGNTLHLSPLPYALPD